VSFFGPFYASYVIANLDRDNYEYALITGPDKSYLWVLARAPSLSDEVLEGLVSQAQEYGFDTSQLIYVNHKK
jgi:apolipoprotein D and lipocalin family protein